MALDSRENRSSAVSLAYAAPPSPTPIATPDKEWRQQAGWGYSPIAIGAIIGQPVMVRMQGVPTMPGYRDRIPKWNAILPPTVFWLIWEMLRQLDL